MAEQYIETIRDQDFGATCELFTAGFLRQLGGEAGCEEALAGQFGEESGPTPELTIAGVRLNGNGANAQLRISRDGSAPSPLTLRLRREDDDTWRIADQQ